MENLNNKHNNLIDYKLYQSIMDNHKRKIGDNLFEFLYINAKPIIITEERIIISLDHFSLVYLVPNSNHFLDFKKTCLNLLTKNSIILNFIKEEEINNYLINPMPNNNLNTNNSAITTNNYSNNNNYVLNSNMQTENYQENIDYDNKIQEFSTSTIDSTLIDTINTDLSLNDENFELQPRTTSEELKYSYKDTNLSNNMTFQNFFYSYENKQIVDASKMIIENIDDVKFNPFFIYGKSGIGKTHILHAIGNEIYNKYSEKNILYLHSQTFIEEYTSLFTGGINNTNKIEEFKNKYNNIDILLIDDIQHLESKEASLTEFFGIFEKMRNSNKMVIIASDKHPEKIHFEERLITRFISGLTCEMKIPDTNTKKEIFQYYALKREFTITDEATNLFIENSKNVRSLIGYLNAITLYSFSNEITGNQITKDIVLSILNENSNNNNRLSDEDIIKLIANFFHIKISDIRGNKRTKNIVNARHFTAYFLRKRLKQKHSKIAYTLGFKDHTAAINAIRAAEVKSKKEEYINDFDKLNEIINDKYSGL